MKNIFIVCAAFLTLTACTKKEATQTKTPQIIEVKTDYTSVFKEFQKDNDTLYVVNFWATWCQPCIEELPDFMKLNEEFKDEGKFKMILVSLDKAADLETKVKPFITKNNITPNVYVLSDNKRMNEWITALNPHWTGAIPATFIYKNNKQLFFTEGKISYKDLKSNLNKFN